MFRAQRQYFDMYCGIFVLRLRSLLNLILADVVGNKRETLPRTSLVVVVVVVVNIGSPKVIFCLNMFRSQAESGRLTLTSTLEFDCLS